jgi:hypothetical protein
LFAGFAVELFGEVVVVVYAEAAVAVFILWLGLFGFAAA